MSEPSKRAPAQKVVRRIAQHEGQFAIASVTWHELRFGAERLPDVMRRDALRESIELLRALVPIYDYDVAAADWHARQRAKMLFAGRTEQPFDGQIAAIATTRRLTLVTANTKHFTDYEDLGVVDWSR
ncbi:MAG TPA: PIN domain-containing protein [Labilithrix sp.]|nr:PIN domain-containing protein [Labilithrix sp.]